MSRRGDSEMMLDPLLLTDRGTTVG
jgi:hypothetical protein